jgi:tetratricopeptide (TPR) repeat protein
LIGASGWYWFVLGHLVEGHRWAERALAASGPDVLAQRALVLAHLGGYALHQLDHAPAVSALEEALALWRSLGDDRGTAFALFRLAHLAHDVGDTARAEALYQASLALPHGEGTAWGFIRGLARTLLARLLLEQGERERAQPLIEEAVREANRANDRAILGSALWNLGWSAHLAGNDDCAIAQLERALALNREVRSHVGILDALWGLGLLVLRSGDTVRAATLLREGLDRSVEQGNHRRLADYLAGLGIIAGESDEGMAGATRASRLFGAAAGLRKANTLSASPMRAVGERAVVAMRDRLGETAFAAAWVSGQAEPLAGIIAEARAVGNGWPSQNTVDT